MWVLSEKITNQNVKNKLSSVDGVIVAPGFGKRGIEGKISTIKYVRENNIPFLEYVLACNVHVLNSVEIF